MKKIFSFILIVLFHLPVNSQSWPDTLAQIEKIMERYKPASPGCQLAISCNGQVIYSKAFGMADLEHNVPLTTQSIIEAGSVSKQFTAAAILLLEQEGKLSLDDDVRKYVPELPDYGKKITLRHMMQHSSGLKDWGSIAAVAGWPRSSKTYNNQDALHIISRQQTLNHAPGDSYVYSNSNYNLFAIITERVSGKSLAEFCRIHIFEPAGMKYTEWRDNYKKIVPNRAIAYEKQGNDYFTAMPNEYVYGNGGLLTTAEDLLRWNDYYLNGKLGSPSLLWKQLATGVYNNGRQGSYAAGLMIDSVRGWKLITHSGATAGYRANLDHFPELDLSIAWLSNSSEMDRPPGSPVNAIRNLFTKNKQETFRPVKPDTFVIAPAVLKTYEGWYMQTITGDGVKLSVIDGKLINNRGGDMVPVGENVFILGANRIELFPGKKSKLAFISRTDTVVFTSVDPAKEDIDYLNAFTGNYYSGETESGFSIRLKDGKLIMHRDPTTDYDLTPTFENGFRFSNGSIIFRRKGKKVTGMNLYTGRAANIWFRRMR